VHLRVQARAMSSLIGTKTMWSNSDLKVKTELNSPDKRVMQKPVDEGMASAHAGYTTLDQVDYDHFKERKGLSPDMNYPQRW
jgi:hypothetical protein